MENDTLAAVLNDAADLIEERGWWDGTNPHRVHSRQCAGQAIITAQSNRRLHGSAPLMAFLSFVGGSTIPTWNDQQACGTDVVQALRDCATKLSLEVTFDE